MSWEVKAMRYKASYCRIAPSIFIENLRRFWYIPTIAFIFMFLQTVLPIVMIGSKNFLGSYLELMFWNKHPGLWGINLILPIASALGIFRYLHTVSGTAYINALPFSRDRLFNTNLLTGWLISIVPTLLLGGILLIMSRPVMSVFTGEWDYSGEIPAKAAINVFAPQVICAWMGVSILTITFIYAISVFAGVVTGTTVHHLIGSVGFNFLVPAAVLTLAGYSEKYLSGYAFNESQLLSFSPWLYAVGKNTLGVKDLIIYIVVTVAILLLCYWLYKMRHMERAGDGVAFGFMLPFISYIFAFFGMSGMGFYLEQIGESEIYFYVGLILGALLFFVIARMILLKTARVFDKRLLKNLLIYAVVAVLFVSSFTMDWFGYETRIPKLSSISSAQLKIDNNSEEYSNRFSPQFFKLSERKVGDNPKYELDSLAEFVLSDSENIKEISELHRNLLANVSPHYNEDEGLVRLTYNIQGDRKIQRRYECVSMRKLLNDKRIRKIYTSKEFKRQYSLYNLAYPVESVYIWGYGVVSEPEKVRGLIAAMEEDFQNSKSADTILSTGGIKLYMQFKPGSDGVMYEPMSIAVDESGKATKAWLQSNGVNIEDIDTKNIKSIKICHAGKVVVSKSKYVLDHIANYNYYYTVPEVDEFLDESQLYRCVIEMKSGKIHTLLYEPENIPWAIEEEFDGKEELKD